MQMENENKYIKDILNNKLIRIVLAALFFLFIHPTPLLLLSECATIYLIEI
jgi:hypothetical protein